ncbi:MAG: PaaI family thioesterase [Acidaminococcales bacterium]|nr:PaaI family thioesterase [Acidaminococcales bacterium]
MREEYPWCFGCGRDNPAGLKLEFTLEQGIYSAVFTPRREHQGYDGMVHGGIIAALLDEVMGDYVYELTGQKAFTARLQLRYRQAAPIGQPLKAESSVLKRKGRLYEMKGEIFLSGGSLAAEAKGKIILA